ncbi:MAG: hypothetical protein MMC23_007005 [Stictis urceolatum]|nr:hypothetical protein [Stictis urceolata]
MAGPRLSLRERYLRLHNVLIIIVPSIVLISALVITLLVVLAPYSSSGGDKENDLHGGVVCSSSSSRHAEKTLTLSGLKLRHFPLTVNATGSCGMLGTVTGSATPSLYDHLLPTGRASASYDPVGFVPYEKSHATRVLADQAVGTAPAGSNGEFVGVRFPLTSDANHVPYSASLLAASLLVGANA